MPLERALISTGLPFAYPKDTTANQATLRTLRQSLVFQWSIRRARSDSDYRGLVKVCLINHGQEPFVINRGDRIAQGVIAQARQWSLVEVDTLSETQRGEGGFGSTGQ